MRSPPVYDIKAEKQIVSVTVNSDLYAQSEGFGIDASQLMEEALVQEVTRRKREQIKAEILQDIEACDRYEAEHGSFADMVREHYENEHDERVAEGE